MECHSYLTLIMIYLIIITCWAIERGIGKHLGDKREAASVAGCIGSDGLYDLQGRYILRMGSSCDNRVTYAKDPDPAWCIRSGLHGREHPSGLRVDIKIWAPKVWQGLSIWVHFGTGRHLHASARKRYKVGPQMLGVAGVYVHSHERILGA